MTHAFESPRSFAALAAALTSAGESPASADWLCTTSAPSFAAASSRLVNCAESVATSALSVLSRALSAAESFAPARMNS